MRRTIGWASLLFVSVSLIGPPSAPAPAPLPQALASFEIILDDLKSPGYLAVDTQDRVFLSLADPGQILQIAPDRSVTVIIDHLKKPEGLTFDSSGALILAAKRWQGADGKGQEGIVLRREPQTQVLSVVASEFKKPKGLTFDQSRHLVLSAK